MEHRRVCFRMLSLLPLVQISKLSQANSLLFGKVCCRTPRGVRGLKSMTVERHYTGESSHPSRGAWIEIKLGYMWLIPKNGRTPRGVRGLKFCYIVSPGYAGESHPSRGAWIEIFSMASRSAPAYCRTPRGVRGLKSPPLIGADIPSRRTPRGVRGLKWNAGRASTHQ